MGSTTRHDSGVASVFIGGASFGGEAALKNGGRLHVQGSNMNKADEKTCGMH